MTPSEVAFRMSQIQERLQVSLDSAAVSAWRRLSSLHEQHSADALENARRAVRHLLQSLRQLVHSHPLAARCHALGERLAAAAYARCLPLLAAVARNSLLAGGLGFALGVGVARALGAGKGAGEVMRPLRMTGIVIERQSDGLSSASIRRDLEQPRLTSPDQVLVRIQMASVDPLDLAMLEGRVKTRGGVAMGRDMVGVVLEVGKRVEGIRVGEKVWSARPLNSPGTFCSHLVLPSSHVRPLPAHLSPSGAATLPFSALLVHQTLTDLCALVPFACHAVSVLVVDGTSATGVCAIQLLRAWGATEVVTCAPYRAAQLAQRLGATRVIPCIPDHVDNEENCALGLQDFAREKFDVVLVTSELLSVKFCRKYLKETGRIALTYQPSSQVDESPSFLSSLLSLVVKPRPLSLIDTDRLEYSNLDKLSELIELGVVQPVLDSVVPLTSAYLALGCAGGGVGDRGKDGAAVGKTVISFVAEDMV